MRILKTIAFSFLFLSLPVAISAQITGGQKAFQYLTVSNSPHVSAMGGTVPVSLDNDVNFVLQNPGLLSESMHNQLALNYNFYYAGIAIANMQYAYYIKSCRTNLGIGVQYLNYGTFDYTDIGGNILGKMSAADYAVTLSVAKNYGEKWRYGANLKWAHSHLADRTAIALLTDIGVSYIDTTNLWAFGMVAKNMGATLKKYNPNNASEPLPFDFQLGVYKRLKNVPLNLFAIAHHLYRWDIRYDNPADKLNNRLIFGNEEEKEKTYFADKLFRHFTFGAELTLGKRLTTTVAYSHLKRRELGFPDAMGAAGFSFGLSVHLNKFHVRYAHAYYGSAGAFNELGISMQLNKLFDIGSLSDKWNWNYPQ